jgi:hypothetical protein
MAFLQGMDPSTGFIDFNESLNIGKELSNTYKKGYPFPYIVIDDFLPSATAERFLIEFDISRNADQKIFNRDQEKFKRGYKPEQLSTEVRQLFYAFNSRPFIRVVENITGIKGLIPDPFFMGGGLHEIENGGRLAVHADFNHHILMNVERRVNLLIYLNKDWRDEFGGQLELWSNDMASCLHSILPIFNRAVLFNTSSHSNHGTPRTITHPKGLSRKSIALYYYTATWENTNKGHTTQFRIIQNSDDRVDWKVRINEFLADIDPPIIMRAIRNYDNRNE